ncbi:MAG: Ig-like domain-containing protein [Chitinivibrionia bacterium]|nr:Ig-like domain-containing protein [Chitinivibrionia bacterium]
MSKALLALLLCLGLALSCAIPEPPSGGPEDKDPPDIAATEPADGSTGVPENAAITFTFSEKMARSKIERLMTSYPPFELGKVEWDDNSLRIQPAQPLRRDTTYCIILKPGFRDLHNVNNAEGHTFAFSTGARLDSGTISGSVLFRRKPSSNAVVRCFVLKADSSLNPASTRPDRETSADAEGKYAFRYLPTSGVRFLLWAFHDQNGNDYYEPGREFGETYRDTVILDASATAVHDASIAIIDPTEPGTIEGSVLNETSADTFPVSVVLYEAADSLRRVAYYGICGPSGAFRFSQVKPGGYALSALLDFRPDSLCGSCPCRGDTTKICIEPCAAYPDSIRVPPGAAITLQPLTLTDTQGEPDDD